jgi:molybdate transport system substrate-binding protein
MGIQFIQSYKEKIMSRSKLLSFLLLIVMLASAACTPQATPTAAPTAAPATQTPVATEAPATEAPAEPVTLTVLAAASLTASFTELAETFQSAHPGVTVEHSFAGSQELAQQLEQGAEADVFASASKKYMESVIASGRVNADASKVFVRNRLVVIFPKDNPGGLTELKDLTKAGLKLDLADQSVPVGQYSLDFLDKAIADPAFDPRFKDNVLKNVVSYETNVKAVVSKVALGEADAGIVYVTDITADIADKVGKLDIPDALNTIATYPIAPIADSNNAELAQAFVDMILSPEGQEIMGKYGFIPAAGGSSSSGGVTITDALGREVKLAAAPKRIFITGKACS